MNEMSAVERVMRTSPVIPVLVVKDASRAVPIAEALVAGGLKVLEVTLRTPAALDVIRAMATVDGAIVGAGTVLNPRQMDEAQQAGATFMVSPGLSPTLVKAALAADMPILPGVANASDIMAGMELGLDRFKFFPAEASGGLKALKAIGGPFGEARFCPTGGISQETAPAWLAEPAVLCVGGSWLVPADDADPAEITARARAAAALQRD